MADPISIIGLVAVVLKSVAQTAEIVENIRRAPTTVQALCEDLRSIEGLLQGLDGTIRGFDQATRVVATSMMSDPLATCQRLTKRADTLIKPFVKDSDKPGMTVWSRFAFTFKETDIEFLQKELLSCKQNMIMAIQCMTL